MIDWKPIETAPKDGSSFMAGGYCSPLLGALPDDKNRVWCVSTMRWMATAHDEFKEVDSGLYRKVPVEDGLFVNVGGAYSGMRATHWMPLPAMPCA